MTRKKLPLSLVLITIVLGGVLLSFTTKHGESRHSQSIANNESMVSVISPSMRYLALIRNNQSTGVITPSDLSRVQSQLSDFNNSRSMANMKWTQLGPDNFGGRTRAIMFDNTDASAKTLFSAGVTGGIWKSEDLGTIWRKANGTHFNLNVSCMKQDANGVIYAGTGESFATETMTALGEMGYTSGFMGQGLFKSTDGDNFTLISSTQPQFNDDNGDWAYINELAIDMGSGRIYAATNAGLKYSSNGGESWDIAKDTSGAELIMNSYDVQVSSDGSVVACIDNQCYISTNGNADSFISRSTGDSISLPADGVSRIEFAFAPSDANVLYATVIDSDGFLYNIYRSGDKGVNWRIIQPGSPSIVIFNGNGVYDNALTVFPEDPDKILVGGTDSWEFKKIQETGFYASKSISTNFTSPYDPDYLHGHHHTYVFRPGSNSAYFVGTDGGISIASINQGEYIYERSNRSYFTTQFYNIAPSGVENYVLGGAQGNGSILINGEGSAVKEGAMIAGGDGGACVVSLINREVLVVSGQGAVLQRSENAGVDYSGQFVGDLDLDADFFNTPMALWENFDNPYSRDSVWYFAKIEIPGGAKIQVQSNNSGQPFYYTTPSDITLMPGDSINIRDVVSSRYFIASTDVVYMTNELHIFTKEPEWFTISNEDVGFGGAPQCISYSSDANHIFVGTREGRLFRISNLALAYNFERADVSSPECVVSTKEIILNVPGGSGTISQVITSIAVDPENPSNVMITLGNYGNDYYVLYSENALDEVPIFNSRQGNLPQMPVYSSIIEMSDGNMGIIGTEHGIFVTEDIHTESPIWLSQDSLMGSVPVFELQQQIVNKTSDTVLLVNGNEVVKIPFSGTNNFGIIYAATFGRGMLRSNAYRKPVGVDEIPNNQTANILNLNVYPNPVTSFATIEFDVAINSDANIFVYDLAGRKVLSRENSVQKGLNKIELDLSNLNSGTYVIQVVIGSSVYSQKIIAN
ncbi:MAG: T9SS type A sorting domain-containing protein [Bacteroidota bacterium]